MMTEDQLRARFDELARRAAEAERESRKPTNTEVRQSRVQFAIHPQAGIPSFSVGCVYCNTGYEDDYFAARVGERLGAFMARHADCRPGCLPPEARKPG